MAGSRSDAQRNRAQILAVARRALANGDAVSMTRIAKLADIGVGTLYRHFPTRDALILELYSQDIQAVIDLAPMLLEQHPPLEALRSWLREVARNGRVKQGAAEVIHAATNNGLNDPNYTPFVDAIRTLLEAGAASGDLKPDLDPEDVLLQLSVLWRIPPTGDVDARTDRILTLITDGLLVVV